MEQQCLFGLHEATKDEAGSNCPKNRAIINRTIDDMTQLEAAVVSNRYGMRGGVKSAYSIYV